MPPKANPVVDEPMEDEPGQDQFIESLTEFAAQRGVNVELSNKVAGRHIDLYTLYNYITARGGYDKVSSEKLAWRKVGTDFNLGTTNAAAYAFALKTTYYKNLAAYEIKHLHGKEPPPVEILEKLTAKGGDILSRTIENFKTPQKSNLTNGGSDSEGEEAKTPKAEGMDIDDQGSGGRSTRGLRQAPPQRVLFQPNVAPSRQVRQSSGQLQSPQPTLAVNNHTGYNYSATSNPSSASFSIANYEPPRQMPLTLRPIVTPGNNYPVFQANIKKIREAKRTMLGLKSPVHHGVMKPGAGFDGPNIYVRTLQGLRSPLPEEQDYALHHLVKISHERGDKYRFDAFPGLGEGLVEFVLQVSSLFYDVEWEICYSQEEHDINILDGIQGTPDIIQRIACLKRLDNADEMESPVFARELTKILEAGLTIRNLALLEDNALYLSEMPPLRDFLAISLNLPPLPMVTELKHYMLDVAEQVSKYWQMDASDPLYRSLLQMIQDGHDRGAILTALRAICRISMNLETTNLLEGVPMLVIRRIFEWAVLEDEELVGASLDFLYQYTAIPANVRYLLDHSSEVSLIPFLGQLTRLLQFRASVAYHKIPATKHIPVKAASEICSVPAELLEQFMKFDEPDRSNQWLRSVFEEDNDSHITQIALWQAYQARFSGHSQQSALLPAAEFIKNVSSIFTGANAQVVTGPAQKFIIKGIRPRHTPVDGKGRVFTRCQWKTHGTNSCGSFHFKPRLMFEHILDAHILIQRSPEGKWDYQPDPSKGSSPRDCFWANCRHFAKRNTSLPTSAELAMHIKTHLPDMSVKSGSRQKHNRNPANQIMPTRISNGNVLSNDMPPLDPELGREATYKQLMYQSTVVDERGNAAGLPLTSILVLRNMARNVPKAMVLIAKDQDSEESMAEARNLWMEQLFEPLKEKLLHVMAHNRPLGSHVSDVISWIDRGSTS